MAGAETHYYPRYNPPPTSEDELGSEALTKGSGTFALTPIFIVFHALTLASAPAPDAIAASAPPSTNKLFEQFMKIYLEA